MPLSNSSARYGAVAKTFHWTVGLGILGMIALGFVAKALPAETSDQIMLKAQFFTLHKTVGVTLFVLAVLRILWAFGQPKPAPASDEGGVTLLLASTAHWLLYALLIVVPLSGWIHHAATTGFAPIAWPFGQSLPFVPKDPQVAQTFANLHFGLIVVLCITVAAHIAGALKHHLIDRDDTLRRMLPGRSAINNPTAETPIMVKLSAPVLAVGILATTLVFSLSAVDRPSAAIVAPEPADSASLAGPTWRVESGEIEFTIRQMGMAVTGRFEDWSAQIAFVETSSDGTHGAVNVTMSIDTMTLGSVTSTAKEADYFDAQTFPTARFEAVLRASEDGAYLADGTLTIKGTSVPVMAPFDLDIADGRARAELTATLDRRDFGIGLGQTDEGTLGFGVDISVEVIAIRETGA